MGGSFSAELIEQKKKNIAEQHIVLDAHFPTVHVEMSQITQVKVINQQTLSAPKRFICDFQTIRQLSSCSPRRVCRYLCKLSDQELRQSAARNMADLMWSTVKEPLDSALCFDKESLDLAFKYFMSPTLTMRLAGLSQITVSHAANTPPLWLSRSGLFNRAST